jgi:hypothetical protein
MPPTAGPSLRPKKKRPLRKNAKVSPIIEVRACAFSSKYSDD